MHVKIETPSLRSKETVLHVLDELQTGMAVESLSNNNINTEYSRYENFDLTRMYNKECFVIQIYQIAIADHIRIIFSHTDRQTDMHHAWS